MAPEIALNVITYHAVIRYVQRVLDVWIDEAEEEAGTRALAERHCAAAGITIDIARRAMMVPDLAAALAAGLSQVRCPEFEAKIVDGQVVTVINHRKRVNWRPPMSRKEGRRYGQSLARRLKRRPAGALP